MIQRIAFFHGLESEAKSEKTDYLESKFPFVYAPPMDYKDSSLFNRVLRDIKEDKIELLTGSSMGGWFAYCLSTLTGIPTLLFNPAVQGRSMEPHVELGNHAAHHTIILGKNDTVIMPEKTVNWFAQTGIGKTDFHWEPNSHRTPLVIFSKWVEKVSSERR